MLHSKEIEVLDAWKKAERGRSRTRSCCRVCAGCGNTEPKKEGNNKRLEGRN